MPRYYVYALCYPDGTPFYIGKGQGKRVDCHEREVKQSRKNNLYKHAIIQQIQQAGQQVNKQKIAEFDCELDAYMYEWAMINMSTYSEKLTNISGTNIRFRNIPKQLPQKHQLIEATEGHYRISEVAKMLDRYNGIVHRHIQEGRLTAIKKGHVTWISQETVDALFQPTTPQEEQEKHMETVKKVPAFTPIKEAAKKLDIHPATLRRAILAGKLEAIQLGKGYRVSDEAIEKWLQSLIVGESDASSSNTAN